MNDNQKRLQEKLERFAEWVISRKVGAVFSYPGTIVFVFLALVHSLYWLTAWWSPVPFLAFTALGLVLVTYLGRSPLTIYSFNFKQAATTDIGAKLMAIGLPFLLAQVAAVFACLYMFGTVLEGTRAISGAWEHFYFSVVTLTTLGYGNLVPAGPWAEFVAIVESLFGFMVFAIYAGILASIAIQRSILGGLDQSAPNAQEGTTLSKAQIEALEIDQEIGMSYFLRFVYLTIYGSQYSLLKRVEREGEISLESAKQSHYGAFVQSLENDVTPPAFDVWLAYLIENMLIVRSDDGLNLRITVNGARFLNEIRTSGANDAFKL